MIYILDTDNVVKLPNKKKIAFLAHSVSVTLPMEVLLFFLPIHISPTAVAVRSKAWIAFTRSNVGSNPTQGMDVCVRLLCVCVVLCVGSGLAKGWSPVQKVLPAVYRIKKLKKGPRSTKEL
jgi:hypothetical protein